MTKEKKLLFFTASFPYGIGEQWKLREVNAACDVFGSVTLVPLHHGATPPAIVLPARCSLISSIEESTYCPVTYDVGSMRDYIRALGFRRFLSALKSAKVYQRRMFFSRFFQSMRHGSYVAKRILQVPPLFEQLPNPNAIWYFFWGRGSAEALPLLRHKIKGKVIVRVHGFDIYLERSKGVLPFYLEVLNSADLVASVSFHGQKYLEGFRPRFTSRVECHRLGTSVPDLTTTSIPDCLHLVSCSAIVSVKRLYLIAESLHRVSSRIKWTHIGGGKPDPLLVSLLEAMPPNIEYSFLGHVEASRVQSVLASGGFSLFINASESEGVPVAVMEALSVGLPVIASDVGGTCELVDDAVGKLFAKDVASSQLARLIDFFASEFPNLERRYKSQCINRFEERCNGLALARNFMERISNV